MRAQKKELEEVFTTLLPEGCTFHKVLDRGEESMTIEEATRAKRGLEMNIVKLLVSFENETGLMVKDIDLKKVDASTFLQTYNVFGVIKVRVEL